MKLNQDQRLAIWGIIMGGVIAMSDFSTYHDGDRAFKAAMTSGFVYLAGFLLMPRWKQRVFGNKDRVNGIA